MGVLHVDRNLRFGALCDAANGTEAFHKGGAVSERVDYAPEGAGESYAVGSARAGLLGDEAGPPRRGHMGTFTKGGH